VKQRVAAMEDYLRSIADAKPSEAAPLPHLERHQAWLLVRGIKYYKDYETYGWLPEEPLIVTSTPIFSRKWITYSK